MLHLLGLILLYDLSYVTIGAPALDLLLSTYYKHHNLWRTPAWTGWMLTLTFLLHLLVMLSDVLCCILTSQMSYTSSKNGLALVLLAACSTGKGDGLIGSYNVIGREFIDNRSKEIYALNMA